MARQPELGQSQSRFENFSERSRKVTNAAQQEAQRLNHIYIGTGHILLGLLKDKSVVELLQALQMSPEQIRKETESLIGRGVREGEKQYGLTLGAKKVIELAVTEAKQEKQITPIHLLIGSLREREWVAAKVLERQTNDDYETLLDKMRGFKAAAEKDDRELEARAKESLLKERLKYLKTFLENPKIDQDTKISITNIIAEIITFAEKTKSKPESRPSV